MSAKEVNKMEQITARTAGALSTGIFSKDYFTSWVNYVDAAPRTIDTYAKNIKRFAEYLEAQGVAEPTRENVIAYREEMKQNHKPATVQGYLAAVKIFFQWTESEGLYPNIADRVKSCKVNTQEHKKGYLTSKQASELLQSADRSSLQGLRDYAILSLMITTGLRTVSVINANLGDLGTVGDSSVLFYQGKGHEEKDAFVKLAEPVERALREYLQARKETSPEAPLFSSVAHRNGGERMTTRSLSRICKGHLVDIGLDSDRLTAHSLRHTAATLNLLNGATLEETRQLLDHKSINTTLIYSHAIERANNNSENRIAAAVFG